MLVKTMQVGQIGTNCYLLGDETTHKCAVVDPGDEAEAIHGMIKEAGMELQVILLTHGHFDHILGIPGLLKLWPETPVYIHKEDYTEEEKDSHYKLGRTPNIRFYSEGDTVAVGSLTVEVLHTPGHSKGSVTLKAGDVLFSGDTLFRGSMGRTDLPGGSYAVLMSSLKRLGGLQGDFKVCPGHEGLSTLEDERKHNYYLQEAMS